MSGASTAAELRVDAPLTRTWNDHQLVDKKFFVVVRLTDASSRGHHRVDPVLEGEETHAHGDPVEIGLCGAPDHDAHQEILCGCVSPEDGPSRVSTHDELGARWYHRGAEDVHETKAFRWARDRQSDLETEQRLRHLLQRIE